ncbi:MAG TPA: hypothetical protein VNW71_08575 [Thermoanaerobaculia bacterium]|nr:hypothetical protein [Thermoanaerobaculia bacterium]
MMEGDLLRDDDTAVPHAISLELFAKLSTGSASPEEVARIFLPHHIETCPSCRALHERLQEIKDNLGYFDELVALLESETAPELARILESLPTMEQLRAAETDESFHTWGLCVYLLQQSKEACLSDARRATELAILAVRIALALPKESYHPDWVHDLQARTFAYLANALKVANELTAADLAFADAERRFSWHSPLVEAELLTIKSSLRREQRRYTEALEAAAAALKIYVDLGDRRGALACQLLETKVYEATQDWANGCDVLQQAENEAGLSGDQRLIAALQSNLVLHLAGAGRYDEALERLPRAMEMLAEHGRDTDRLRLRWTEALVLDGLGRIEEAETALRALQQEFLDRRMPLDATLVSLDLAVVLFKSGKADALTTLAAELLPIFESRGLTTEAIVAYTLLQLQRAVEGRTFTLQLAAELARRVRAEGRGR